MDNDKQMKRLFEEGGIADDGMNRDPISGNEVPPGSLAEEVRDDIPAQLSEGEYVVPADVLRYYGVKFFEDLRTEAKQGLGQMEADGRIGGEPIDMADTEQLSPEEEAELQAMIGMAVGGMVTEQPTQATDPYMTQADLYRAPAPVAIGNAGYNEGGVVADPTQAQFDPSQFAPGFTFARPTPRPETRSLVLYGPNGEIRNVMFPSAEYDRLIADGFTTQQSSGAAVTPEATLEIAGTEGGGGGGGFTTFSGDAPRELSELTVEELQSNLSGLDTMNRIGGALASAVNPVFAMAARAALSANRANIVQELVNRGVDMSDYRADKGRDLYGGGISMYDGLQDQPGSRSGVDFGDTWLGDAIGFDGKAGVQGPGLKDSRDGARRDFTGGGTPAASTGGRTGSDNDGGDTSRAPSSSPTPSRSPRGDSAADVAADDRNRQTASQASAQRAADRQGTSLATGGRAEGGFVSRRNKNKK